MLESPEKLELVNKFAEDTNILGVYDSIKKSKAAFKKRLEYKRLTLPGKLGYCSSTPPAPLPPPPPPPPPPPTPPQSNALSVNKFCSVAEPK